MGDEISVFECKRCDISWDDYECFRKYRLRKCSICHSEICRICFADPKNKQHCSLCDFKIRWCKGVEREINQCLLNRK